MLLIIPGNPNLKTIRNVIYFANNNYDRKITHVFFIDTKQSLYDRENKPLECRRNSIVRQYIPKARIESSLHEKGELHVEIPKILSEKLKLFDEENIIVDLTNGNKYISNILYASASLSKISKLFFIFVDPSKQEENPENLNTTDYSIEVVSALENLESIGKYTFFEITYYKDASEQLVYNFNDIGFRSSFLNNMLNLQIRDAVRKYFSESYSDCISGLGQIVEEISIELTNIIRNKAKGEIKAKNPKTFHDSIKWLRENFCEPLRAKRNKSLLSYEEELKPLQNVDKIIDTIRVYRNISVHGGYDVLREKDDAKLILNMTIYLLNTLKNTGVFK